MDSLLHLLWILPLAFILHALFWRWEYQQRRRP